MGRKFMVWLDSGANHSSKYEEVVDLDEIGYTSSEWDALSDERKEEEMKDIAWQQSDWGFEEIT
ncbi:DUF7167 family protein [Pluralibacter gergoviae]|uniref:DUF7167 family protein n=1 Tax=Pluralibacter gergoviae TaxID=61647 RepID=UPI001FF52381|nr:hypothetical protein [Pluralibacter gergoviae]MCK1065037.1 hypothetical protein [Pluralibacter gergoviae]